MVVADIQLSWRIPGQEFGVALGSGSAGGSGRGAPGPWLPRGGRCVIRDRPLRCSASSRQEHVRACWEAERDNPEKCKFGKYWCIQNEVAMSILGERKTTETVHLLFVSSLWYQEIQSRYSDTKKCLSIIRLDVRNIMLYWATWLGDDYIPKPTRHKWVIYKRKGRKVSCERGEKCHVICWNCCNVMKVICRNTHNSPRNTACVSSHP